MKASYWFGLGAAVIGAVQINACSSEFRSCEDFRTCGPGGTSSLGSAGASEAGANESDAGAPNAAGAGGALGEGGTSGVSGAGAGGSSDGGEGPIDAAPTVISISPLDQTTSADPVKPIVLTFSEALDPKTVTADSVTLKDADGALVPGKVSYADAVVTFTPDSRLNLLGAYQVDVTAALTDVGGTGLAKAFSSAFTVRDGVWGKEQAIPNNPQIVKVVVA